MADTDTDMTGTTRSTDGPAGDGRSRAGATATAALLLIGDELLSGRTRDANLAALGKALGGRGVDIVEARIVADRREAIVEAVNALRARCSVLFTSGGIGPTHDDITTDSVAEAFGVSVVTDPEAERRLEAFWAAKDLEPNAARRRMARIPEGAALIDNDISAAPGFRIGNVYVMAGVPSVFANMVAHVIEDLPRGRRQRSVTVRTRLGEGSIAEALDALQRRWPEVALGSYPGDDDRPGIELVARSRDEATLEAVGDALEALVRDLGGEVLERELDTPGGGH